VGMAPAALLIPAGGRRGAPGGRLAEVEHLRRFQPGEVRMGEDHDLLVVPGAHGVTATRNRRPRQETPSHALNHPGMTSAAHSPSFSRLYTALMGGVPDRVPTAELKVDEPVKEAFLGRKFPDMKTDPRGYLEADLEFQLAAGYDYLRVAPQVAYPDHWHAQQHRYSIYSDEVQTRKWAITGQGMIATDDDFERFPWPDPAQATYEWLELAATILDRVGQASRLPLNAGETPAPREPMTPAPRAFGPMELLTSLKGGGIFERAWMLMGFEGFAVATLENPDLVARVIEKTGSIYYHYLRRAFEYPHVAGVWLGDDMAYSTGLMVSPSVHRKWVFPWYQRIAELCRSYDPPKAFIFHSDGLLWEVVPDLIACGINALHPIDPTAMDIGEVKRRYGDKLCLIGNIDLGYTLTRGTPEETREEVRQRIATCAPGGGYVVSSANSITEYVKLENYRAMLAAVREFGGKR